GVGDYTATLAARLHDQGAAIGVLTGPAPAGATNPPPADLLVMRGAGEWRLGDWQSLTTAIAGQQPSIVHIQYQAGAFGGRAAVHLLPRWLRQRPNPPVVLTTFHDLNVPYLFPKAGPLRRLVRRQLVNDSNAVIATNGEDWHDLRAGRPVAELLLIPIGSNIPPLPASERAAARQAVRAALGLPPDTLLLAYFGLVSASKGLDTLLDALQERERAAPGRQRLLVIGGDASATDQARFGAAPNFAAAMQARGLADRVTTTGALPPTEVAAHLAAADCAVLPYRDGASWRRGSLLAALTAGVPVVTTTPRAGYDAGGILPRLLDGDNALLTSPGDASALAAALARLADDAALRDRLAAGARDLAGAFGWDVIVRAHLALYEMLLARRLTPTGAAG
ncbi:MAG: glycosyltransferase, partial [Thermomicrobiales bacterium]